MGRPPPRAWGAVPIRIARRRGYCVGAAKCCAAESPLPSPMNKPLSLTILAVGIVLLVFGLNSHESLASTAKEAVTGTPTDKSMWLIVLGIVGIVIGGFNSLFRRSS